MLRRKPKKNIRKQMLVNIGGKENRIAIVEDGVLEEFYLERLASKGLVGNIYKGKIGAILPGIGAAFVDIGAGKNGFLYLEEKHGSYDLLAEEVDSSFPRKKENQASLAKGQEVLVQVVREGIGNKGPRLTRRISIPGRYLVLIPYEHHIGISKRIADPKERTRIKKIISGLKLPKDIGFIVRTEAEGVNPRAFARECRYLTNLWKKVIVRAKAQPAPNLIYEEYDLVLRAARDLFTKEIDIILIDSKEEFRRIYNFIRSFLPHFRRRIRFYRGTEPLFKNVGIEDQINMTFDRKISLKSGGYIIIEPTEALVSIDVNTGQFVGAKGSKRDPEQTAFLTNREAAREITKQLRLKDLGGIIIIDFIDMRKRDHERAVLNELKEGIKRDKAKIKILPFSEIGLVEMTRQRMRKGLESTSYKTCPNCKGRGLVREDTSESPGSGASGSRR